MYSGPPVSLGSVSGESTNLRLKIADGEKKDSRKFQKHYLNLLYIGNYLHSIYIVLGIIM